MIDVNNQHYWLDPNSLTQSISQLFSCDRILWNSVWEDVTRIRHGYSKHPSPASFTNPPPHPPVDGFAFSVHVNLVSAFTVSFPDGRFSCLFTDEHQKLLQPKTGSWTCHSFVLFTNDTAPPPPPSWPLPSKKSNLNLIIDARHATCISTTMKEFCHKVWSSITHAIYYIELNLNK